MLIRIKFEGKSRKLSERVSTVTDLKRKISELFGTPSNDMHIVYKDCDGEIVNVMDDEDLRNCYNEANDLKLTSLTFLVRTKSESRSQSPQNDSGNRNGKGETDQKKPRGPSRGGDRRQDDGFGDNEGDIQKLKQTLIKMKFMSEKCIEKGVEDPLAILKNSLNSLESECSGLAYNPVLLAATFAQAKEDMGRALRKGYQEVILKNPDLLKKNDECERQWRDFKHAVRDVERRKERNQSESKERSEKGVPQVTQQRNRSKGRNVEKGAPFRDRFQQNHQKDLDYDRRDSGYKSSHTQRRWGNYESERRYNEQEKEEDYDRGYRKDSYSSRRHEDPKDRDRILYLCRQFKNKSMAEIRIIVEHNPDKSTHELESMILQSRKSKSSFY